MIDARIRELRAATYRVPTDAPEADGTFAWDATTMVVVHADAGEVTGLGWTYTAPGCADVVRGPLAEAVTGLDVRDVPAAWHAMQRQVRNAGRPGLVSTAMSAVDCALWDAAARLHGLPLHRLLGRCREDAPVYGSGGFISYDDARLVKQVSGWVHDQGIPRVKIKIGESWAPRSGATLPGSRRSESWSARTSRCTSTRTAATRWARPCGWAGGSTSSG